MPDAAPTLDDPDELDGRLGFLRLDAQSRETLRKVRGEVMAALPAITDRFYRFLAGWPAMRPLLGDASKIESLKKSQHDHWDRLLQGDFGPAYVSRAKAVGLAHERIGLEPRWYIGAYCFILESLVEVLLAGRGSQGEKARKINVLFRAAFLDMDLATSTYIKSGDESRIKMEMMMLAEVMENEVDSSVGLISDQTRNMAERAQSLASVSKQLRETATTVEGSVNTTIDNVNSVAAATEQMDSSCKDIASRVVQATALTNNVIAAVDKTEDAMRGLSEAASRIKEVVSIIEVIADQTKLLALNATIEAARSGEAGRGFAVVASEVKALANQTENAIKTIHDQVGHIGLVTQDAVVSVNEITSEIRSIHQVAAEVASATEQQQQASDEIARSASSAAGQTQVVGDQAQDVLHQAVTTGNAAEGVSSISGRICYSVEELQRRLNMMLRASAAGNRRRHERYPMGTECQLLVGEKRLTGQLSDLSAGGALISCKDNLVQSKDAVTLQIDGLGRLPARVVAVGTRGIHLNFAAGGKEVLSEIAGFIERHKKADGKYIDACKGAAAAVSKALTAAIDANRISLEDLFDQGYTAIPDTDPLQMKALFTDLTDEIVPPIIEPIIERDRRIAFCAPVDRNGYLPTHNKKYSHPQRPTDPTWNAANCRNRRIFDDPAGIAAALSLHPILVQTYARDMGGGTTILLKEFDAPIPVRGRHWGSFRLAIIPES